MGGGLRETADLREGMYRPRSPGAHTIATRICSQHRPSCTIARGRQTYKGNPAANAERMKLFEANALAANGL